jgi:hypothetical protein
MTKIRKREPKRHSVYLSDEEHDLVIEALDTAAVALTDVDDHGNYTQSELDALYTKADKMTTLSMRLDRG